MASSPKLAWAGAQGISQRWKAGKRGHRNTSRGDPLTRAPPQWLGHRFGNKNKPPIGLSVFATDRDFAAYAEILEVGLHEVGE